MYDFNYIKEGLERVRKRKKRNTKEYFELIDREKIDERDFLGRKRDRALAKGLGQVGLLLGVISYGQDKKRKTKKKKGTTMKDS